MEEDRHEIRTTDDTVVIDLVSRYGHRTSFTIAIHRYNIEVKAIHCKQDGTIGEDGIALAPIDKNTVSLFI